MALDDPPMPPAGHARCPGPSTRDITLAVGEACRGDADGFVPFAQGVLTPHGTKHLIGQVRIDFESADTAFREVYFKSSHRIAIEASGPADLFVAGRYERRAGTWKIAHRIEMVEWVRIKPDADDLLRLQRGFPTGARAPDGLGCRRDETRVA